MGIEELGNGVETLEQKRQRLVDAVGSVLHEEWRKGYGESAKNKNEDGSVKPRVKKTKDAEWIAANGKDEVDIYAASYAELPEDWKGENKASAEVAVDEILKAQDSGKALNESFIEEASAVIHEKWLDRNGSWAPVEQNKPYAELSEEEKEKDRVVIREAIKALG